MNSLTEEEINHYVVSGNSRTGVKAITKRELENIDLDVVQEVEVVPGLIKNKEGKVMFKFDSFTPKANSIYLKPSFAGRQILMGRTGRKLHFSNGCWFQV